MKKQVITGIVSTAALMALTLTPSFGQNQPPVGGGQRQGGFGRGNRVGGMGGFGMIMNPQMQQMGSQLIQFFAGDMGRAGAPIDPTSSNMISLLQRDDVRYELALTNKQRDDLDKLRTDARTELPGKLRADAQQAMVEMRTKNNGDMRNMTPEERMTQMNQMMKKFSDSVQTYVGDTDKKAMALLKPAQITRLKQLDLQWRGPMAVGETGLADELQLAPEQRTEVAKILQDYRTQQMALMAKVTTPPNNSEGGTAAQGGPGNPANPGDATAVPGGRRGAGNRGGGNMMFGMGQVTMPTDPDAKYRLMEAQKQLQIVAKKKNAETLALMDATQRDQWKQLQGKKFTFRVTIQ